MCSVSECDFVVAVSEFEVFTATNIDLLLYCFVSCSQVLVTVGCPVWVIAGGLDGAPNSVTGSCG